MPQTPQILQEHATSRIPILNSNILDLLHLTMNYIQTLAIKDLTTQYNHNYITERQFLINLIHRLKQLPITPTTLINNIEQALLDPNTDEDDANQLLRELYDWSDNNQTLVHA